MSRDDGTTWQVLDSLYAGGSADCAYPSLVKLPGRKVCCVFYTSPQPTADGPNTEIRGLVMADRTAT